MLEKRCGFTLMEILGAIIIMGLLLLLTFPSIIGRIKKATIDIDKATKELIFSSSVIYLEKNKNDFPLTKGNVYCLSLETLINSGELMDNLINVKTGEKIDSTNVIKITIKNGANLDYKIVKPNQCTEVINEPEIPEEPEIPDEPIYYADNSGASQPVLGEGMIPIKWSSNKWVKADLEQKWYDYDLKEWANVVLVTNALRDYYKDGDSGIDINESHVLAYLVWVPRYKYKLFNVNTDWQIDPRLIEIEFESKTTSKSMGTKNGQWLTHPAFTFGTKELEGFWVGKFETTGTSQTPTVKPRISALRNQTVSQQFNTLKKFNTQTTYGLPSSLDAHMMKNIEWGAVTYLSHSNYGKGNKEVWINNSPGYTTGCGGSSASDSPNPWYDCPIQYDADPNGYNSGEASTSGNLYGVYDMSGGSWECVMGVMRASNGIDLILGVSGFTKTTLPDEKYIDKYIYGQGDWEHYNRILGDATGETSEWYEDYNYFIDNNSSWFYRGGNSESGIRAGLFGYHHDTGLADNDVGCRLVVS